MSKRAETNEKNFILGSIFGLKKEAKPKYEQVSLPDNVQKLPLLKAVTNIDPQVKEQAALVVVDNSALSNENTGVDGAKISPADFKTISDQISVYVVREGDNLSTIAEMYDVTPNTIRAANDIGPSEPIKPGQSLVILPISGLRYTTKKGDTLASIAKVSGGNADEIASFNDLKTNQVLAVGTTIIIPDAEDMGPHNETSTKKPTQQKRKIAPNIRKVASSGYYACPINAIKTQGIHDGNAVDYGAPIGTAIIAAADGRVIISRMGYNGGYGNYVVIQHANGTQTIYAHQSRLGVSVGDFVVKGQVIGYIGNTGRSTGPHVHFEIRGPVSNPC